MAAQDKRGRESKKKRTQGRSSFPRLYSLFGKAK